MLVGGGGFGNAFLGWFDKNTFAPSKRGDGVAVAVKEYFPSTAQGRDQRLDFNAKLGDFGPEMEEIAVTTRVQSYSDPYYCLTDMTVEVSELFTRELTRYIEETGELAMKGLMANRHILDLASNELLEKSRITGWKSKRKLKDCLERCLKIL